MDKKKYVSRWEVSGVKLYVVERTDTGHHYENTLIQIYWKFYNKKKKKKI